MKKELFSALIIIAFFIGFFGFVSGVYFGAPTAQNNSLQSSNIIFMNVSVSDMNGALKYILVNLNNTLAGWYRLDNSSAVGENGSRIYDWSGNQYNGTAMNGAFVNSTGRFAGAFQFDGVNDFINISTNFGLGRGNSTIAAWAYLPNTSMKGAFVKVGGDGATGYGIGVGSSTYDTLGNELLVIFEGVRWIDTDTSIGTGWHHVAVTLNDSGVPYIYLDGALVNISSGSVPLTPAVQTQIGGYDNGGGRYFSGLVDEVVIVNRTLTTREIGALYNSTLYPYITNFTSLRNGSYTITAYGVNASGNMTRNSTYITVNTSFIPPSINISVVYPLSNISVPKGSFFNVSFNISCGALDCGQINVSLDPEESEEIKLEIGNKDQLSTLSAILLYDNKTFEYDIQDGCTISDGMADVFDTGLVLNINSSQYTGTRSTTEDSGREAVCDGQIKSLMNISRKVYVPITENWARYLEILHNPNSSTICVDVQISNNMGSDGSDFLNTSDGDSRWNLTDYWMMWDDTSAAGSDDAAGFIYQSAGAEENIDTLSPGVASGGANSWNWNNVCVPAGNTKILMFFFTQMDTRLQAENESEIIYQGLLRNENKYTSGMTGTEISQVVNFRLGKAGRLINSTEGATPFYTNESNPRNITLSANQSIIINFWVNATGGAGTYNFFAFANITNLMNISSISDNFNVTVYEVDSSAPTVTLNSPSSGYTNFTSNNVNITFNCSASDSNGLSNASLYLSNSSTGNFILNRTINLSGTSNSTTWSMVLGNGNYTWGCQSADISGNSAFSSNRSLYIYYDPTRCLNLSDPTSWPGKLLNQSSSYYIRANATLCTGNYVLPGSYAAYIDAHNIQINCNQSRIQSNSNFGFYLNGKENLSISNCFFNNTYYGIYAYNSKNARMVNNTMANNNYGIYLYYNSMNSTIANNTMTNVTGGVYAYYNTPNASILNNNISGKGSSVSNTWGIYSYYYSDDNLIANNTISNFYYDISISGLNRQRVIGNNLSFGYYPIYFATVTDSVIQENYITNGTIPIHVTSSTRVNISSNTIYDSGYGVYSYTSTGSQIINNTVIRSLYYAIYPIYGSNTLVENNTAIGGTHGVYLYSTTNVTIRGNYLANQSTYGVYSSSSTASVINNILNNTNNFYADSGVRINDTQTSGTNIVGGSLFGGNFYTNAVARGYSDICADSNANGICDGSYNFSSSIRDFVTLASVSATPSIPVQVLYPQNNTYVNGNATITASTSSNYGVYNLLFEYKNSTVGYTTLCNVTNSTYACLWRTDLFSDSDSGYDIRLTTYDLRGNSNSTITHFIIDRDLPVTKDISVAYPTGQSSVRNGQNVTLSVNITDSGSVGSGINTTKTAMTSLNGTGNATFALSAGSQGTGSWSSWNLSLRINTTTGTKSARIYAYDNATPLNNLRDSDSFSVIVDNTGPTYSSPASSGPVYQNENITFSANLFDNYLVSYYILSTNSSGNWTNESISINDTSVNAAIVKTFSSSGNFSFRFFAYDDAGNINSSAAQNFQILQQRQELSVNLETPTNENTSTNSSINFTFSYSQGLAKNCSLYLNSTINSTLNNPNNGTNLSFLVTLNDGNYLWYVNCIHNVTNVSYPTFLRSLNVDGASPYITISYPTNTTYNGSRPVEFNYTAVDSNINACWYSTDRGVTNSSRDYGCTNFTGLSATLNENYWTIYALDLSGKLNSTSINFTYRPLQGYLVNDTRVRGNSDSSIIVSGSTNFTQEYAGVNEVNIFDNSNLLVNFTHNFSRTTLDASRFSIQKGSNYLLLNFSGQLESNKTIYLTDSSFVTLCVKDDVVNSLSDISSSCTGANETNFTTCIGNSSGVTISGITCTDQGSTFKIENLAHSGVTGDIADDSESEENTSSTSASSRDTIVYRIKNSELEEGFSRKLKTSDMYEFSLNGNNRLTLVSYSSSSATLKLNSEYIYLNRGESRIVNLGGDYILLSYQSSDVVGAEIPIKRYYNIQNETVQEIEPEYSPQENKTNYKIIIYPLIAIAAIAGIFYYVRRRDYLKRYGYS